MTDKHLLIENNKAPWPEYFNSILGNNENSVRSKNKLIIQKPNSNAHECSLFVGGPKLWNTIPGVMKE